MVRTVRLIGIAIGSLVMAYLAASLMVGVLLGPTILQSPWYGVAVVVFGGMIFADIVRRDRPATV